MYYTVIRSYLNLFNERICKFVATTYSILRNAIFEERKRKKEEEMKRNRRNLFDVTFFYMY